MTLFTDSELDILAKAGKILAVKKLELLRGDIALWRKMTVINKALANYPDWRKLNEEV